MAAAEHGTKAKKRGSTLWRVVFWIALAVCVCSLGALGYIVYGYYSADKGYQEIATQAFSPDQVQADEGLTGPALGDLTVDWDYLRSINPQVVGWIYMPGTRINYPIAHTDDNDYYLHTDFNGGYARGGAIFLDGNDHADWSSENNVIYGHHMQDGSMFACLSQQLVNNDEFNAHRTVYVLTPTMNYQCESFAMVLTTGYDLLVQTSFASPSERAEYITDKQQRSVVQPAEGMPDAKTIPRLVTLSTCDYTQENGRAVMFTRIVAQAVPGSGSAGEPVADDAQAALDEGLDYEKQFN